MVEKRKDSRNVLAAVFSRVSGYVLATRPGVLEDLVVLVQTFYEQDQQQLGLGPRFAGLRTVGARVLPLKQEVHEGSESPLDVQVLEREGPVLKGLGVVRRQAEVVGVAELVERSLRGFLRSELLQRSVGQWYFKHLKALL